MHHRNTASVYTIGTMYPRNNAPQKTLSNFAHLVLEAYVLWEVVFGGIPGALRWLPGLLALGGGPSSLALPGPQFLTLGPGGQRLAGTAGTMDKGGSKRYQSTAKNDLPVKM